MILRLSNDGFVQLSEKVRVGLRSSMTMTRAIAIEEGLSIAAGQIGPVHPWVRFGQQRLRLRPPQFPSNLIDAHATKLPCFFVGGSLSSAGSFTWIWRIT